MYRPLERIDEPFLANKTASTAVAYGDVLNQVILGSVSDQGEKTMETAHAWRRGNYLISTDKNRLNLTVIHAFLTLSYWAEGIPMEIVKKSIEHSLCFGVYVEEPGEHGERAERQVGFARVITDYATFAYIGDVFILEEYRGRGLSKWLMEMIAEHPELQGLRTWALFTRDAHGLYEKTGFVRGERAERLMVKGSSDTYTRLKS